MKTPRVFRFLRIHSWRIAFVGALGFTQLHAAVAQESPGSATPDELRLRDYRPRSIHRVPETRPRRARFPVVDVHSHAYVRTQDQVDAWVRTMDEVGIERTIILSGVTGAEFDAVLARFGRHRDRFSIWCGFKLDGADQLGFGPAAVAELDRCRKAGAAGVGELSDKGGGLRGAPNGAGLHIDDPRMDVLLEACAGWGLPINIHVGEPIWMYEPMDARNDGLMNAFKWRLDNRTNILGHAAVVGTLERALKRHPRTTFIACHLANCGYDPSILGGLLDAHPNLYADIAARYAETAPIPRFMGRFFERYQDRLLYGTDMGVGRDMYLTTFRILETEDEHFYDWNLFSYHWPLHGFGLTDDVLRKVYGGNARRLLALPELR